MCRLCPLLIFLVFAAPAAAQDMPLSQILIEGEGWRPLPTKIEAITAIATERAGTLLVADEDCVYRIYGNGQVAAIAVHGTNVTSLACTQDDTVYFAEPKKRRIRVINSKGKHEVEVLTDGLSARHLVVTHHNRVYCTVPDEKAVYLVTPDGKKRKVAEGFITPSGLALWPDHGTLVVGDAGDKYLWTFRIEKDGSLAHRERYYPLRVRQGRTESGAAGMTTDSAGRLYVATTEGVQMFDPTGRLSGVLLKPREAPLVGIALGGKDLDTLYLACGDQAYYRKTQAKAAWPKPER